MSQSPHVDETGLAPKSAPGNLDAPLHVVDVAPSRPVGRSSAYVVLGGALVALLYGCGARTFDLADVVRYAQMTFEMRHAHTLIPTFDGAPYYGAMPLPTWAALAFSSLSGTVTPAAARVLPALASIATVALLLWFGRRHVSRRVGSLAAAAVCLNALTIAYGRGSRIDTTLGLGVTLFALGAFCAFAAWERGWRRRAGWSIAAGVGLALAVAAKGPAAAALGLAAVLPYAAVERRFVSALQFCLVSACVTVALSAAWLVPYARLLGPVEWHAFLRQFVGNETIAKVQGEYGKTEPIWTYAVEFVPKLFPWSLPALWATVRVLRRPSAATPVERFAVGWLVVPLLLLSLAGGKHVRYLIPLIPAVALLAGIELDRWAAGASDVWRRVARNSGWVLAGAAGAAGVAVTAYAVLHDGATVVRLLPGVATVAAAAYALWGLAKRRADSASRGLYLAVCGCVALHFGVFLALPSTQSERSSYHRLAEQLSAEPGGLVRGLAVVPPRRRRRRVGVTLRSRQLGLYLGEWVDDATDRDALPAGPLLARGPIADRVVLREFMFRPDDDLREQRWRLLGGRHTP